MDEPIKKFVVLFMAPDIGEEQSFHDVEVVQIVATIEEARRVINWNNIAGEICQDLVIEDDASDDPHSILVAKGGDGYVWYRVIKAIFRDV